MSTYYIADRLKILLLWQVGLIANINMLFFQHPLSKSQQFFDAPTFESAQPPAIKNDWSLNYIRHQHRQASSDWNSCDLQDWKCPDELVIAIDGQWLIHVEVYELPRR